MLSEEPEGVLMETTMGCYGSMFPDLDRLEGNRPVHGRVFEVLLESKGIGLSGRSITADQAQWKKCTACEQYRSCYDLSMAKLLLYLAVRQVE